MKRLIVLILTFVLCNTNVLFAEEVLVLGNESMPFNGIVDGKDAGMTYEILREAVKYGAPEFKFQLGLPWQRAQLRISKAGDSPVAIVPFSMTPEREPNHTWIAKLFDCPVRLSTYKRPAVTIEEAKKMTVGMIFGSANISLFEAVGIKYFDFANNAKQNALKLATGRFEVLGEAKYVDTYAWRQIGMNVSDLNFTDMGNPRQVFIAGNLQFPPELARKIRNAINKMRANGRIDEILEKWE